MTTMIWLVRRKSRQERSLSFFVQFSLPSRCVMRDIRHCCLQYKARASRSLEVFTAVSIYGSWGIRGIIFSTLVFKSHSRMVNLRIIRTSEENYGNEHVIGAWWWQRDDKNKPPQNYFLPISDGTKWYYTIGGCSIHCKKQQLASMSQHHLDGNPRTNSFWIVNPKKKGSMQV